MQHLAETGRQKRTVNKFPVKVKIIVDFWFLEEYICHIIFFEHLVS